jgi:excisionase family DNA binding protein
VPRLKKKWMQRTEPETKHEAPRLPEYLNLRQAAQYLGVKLWTIRRLIAKRFLIAKRVGKYFIVRRVDLDAYWQNAERAA